jgi:hypothetical protein
MDDQTQQFGSFGSVSPDGMQAIKDAILRRQGGGGGTAPLPSQGGNIASPTAGGQLPTNPIPQDMGQVPTAAPQVVPQGNPEAKLIVGALKERLKAISTVEMGGMA